MKRGTFKRPQLERKRAPLLPGTGRGVHAASSDVPVTVPKEKLVRSEAYRRLVASLPCDRCGIHGLSQAAHADQGKGMAIKSSDLTCIPLCGPHDGDGLPGCHYLIGSHGLLMKERRREYEAEAGERTRIKLLLMAQHDPKIAKVLRDVGLLP